MSEDVFRTRYRVPQLFREPCISSPCSEHGRQSSRVASFSINSWRVVYRGEETIRHLRERQDGRVIINTVFWPEQGSRKATHKKKKK